MQMMKIDNQENQEADLHVQRCREYSRRKRALLEQFPNISHEEYEQQIKRIAVEVGI